MNYLILSQLFIGILFLKFYRFLPVLERKNEKKIYSAGYFFAISLIVYFIFSEISLEDKILFIIFPLAAFSLGALDDFKNINPWLRLLTLSLITIFLILYNNNFNLSFLSFNSKIYKLDYPFDIFFTCLCFLLLNATATSCSCLFCHFFIFNSVFSFISFLCMLLSLVGLRWNMCFMCFCTIPRCIMLVCFPCCTFAHVMCFLCFCMRPRRLAQLIYVCFFFYCCLFFFDF